MKFSRRSFLKGLAGTSIALPFFESVAHAATSPKRFITVFTPNGLPKPEWRPVGTETNFTLGNILKPLEPHRAYLNIIDGLDNRAANCGGHDTSSLSLFTGSSVQSISPAVNRGLSIDQAIANAIGAGTKVQSVQLGVKSGEISGRYISFSGPGVALPAQNDPMRTYMRLFGGGVGGNPEADAALLRIRKRRQAVMDGAMSEIASLKTRLSSGDKQKLDAHLEAIRAVEKGLDAPGQTLVCAAPGAPPTLDPRANANFPAILDLQTKLLVLAMRCDITRVASLQWSESTGMIPFTWLGINTEAHELSHRCGIDADYVKICTWYSTKFGELLTQLRDPAFVDGNGKNLLDQTAVVWVNELSACTHDNLDMPVVLAGKAGVDLKTNRFLDYARSTGCRDDSGTLNQLYVSLLNMYGVAQNQFGDASIPAGPLPRLVV
ncbi:MAG: DUF1552 domain-containing protein [Polyangiaceae bacterium]|nr:DUF1552 domain-containing protein [Polyangiaceae bacterium]